MATVSQETCHSLPELVKWILAHGLKCRLKHLAASRTAIGQTATGRTSTRRWTGGWPTPSTKPSRNWKLPPSSSTCGPASISVSSTSTGRLCAGPPGGIGHNHLVIKPDGTMVACPMTVAEEGLPSSGDLLATAPDVPPLPLRQGSRSPGGRLLSLPLVRRLLRGMPDHQHEDYRASLHPIATLLVLQSRHPQYLRFFGGSSSRPSTASPADVECPLNTVEGMFLAGRMSLSSEGGPQCRLMTLTRKLRFWCPAEADREADQRVGEYAW